MSTYNPKISISSAPGITDYLRLALYEATAPNTEVASSAQLPPPHNASRQLQFLGLNPVIHIAKLFRTDGINPEGTVIANFSIDPRYPGVEMKGNLYLYANASAGLTAGTAVFSDPTSELEGWDYEVEIRGIGTLVDNEEIRRDLPPGYQILIPDYVIGENELHIVKFKPKIITYAEGTNPSAQLFSGIEVVTTNRTLVAADASKQLMVQGATSAITLTLPEIDSVVAGKLFMITSNGGSHKNMRLLVNGSDSEKIYWQNQQLTELLLGQSEHVWLTKWVNPGNISDRRWLVLQCSHGPELVGTILHDYQLTDRLNTVFANGQLLDRTVYRRLWLYVQSLDSSLLISDATWNTGTANKGKYSTGDGSTTFRVPLLHAPGFLRGVDGSVRKAGTYQDSQVGNFTADITLPKGHSYGGGPNVARGGNGGNNPQDIVHEDIAITTGNADTLPPSTGAYLHIRI